jgi:hypothetical protein
VVAAVAAVVVVVVVVVAVRISLLSTFAKVPVLQI